MKNIKNIIIALICCLCLLGTTISTTKATTVVPSEPTPAYCMVCVFVCGYLRGYPYMNCLSNAEYDALEERLNESC
jgi:hypothetical protein